MSDAAWINTKGNKWKKRVGKFVVTVYPRYLFWDVSICINNGTIYSYEGYRKLSEAFRAGEKLIAGLEELRVGAERRGAE